MAEYPGSERERRVTAERLQDSATAIFAACGMSDGDAGLLARRWSTPTCAASTATACCAFPTM